jgi:hypothetical protein
VNRPVIWPIHPILAVSLFSLPFYLFKAYNFNYFRCQENIKKNLKTRHTPMNLDTSTDTHSQVLNVDEILVRNILPSPKKVSNICHKRPHFAHITSLAHPVSKKEKVQKQIPSKITLNEKFELHNQADIGGRSQNQKRKTCIPKSATKSIENSRKSKRIRF